ncbi:MAG: ABC transporter permease [Oscillospiraceae bacterium]
MDMFINFLVAAVLAGASLLYGTVGEIINQKSGHLNLGVEGMMAIGACAGFMAGYRSDSLVIAMLAAFLSGAAAALIYAVLTVTFMADQNVTGLTLTIFGCGLSNFIGEYNITRSETGNLKLPEHIMSQLRNIYIPILSDIPVVGKLLFSYNIFIYLGVIIAVIVFIYLNKTKAGLNLRTIGENPAAADAVGIHVVRSKYINLLLGGGICGIGGAYCSMVVCGGVWMSNSVNGMGWISVALVIFAAWSPLKAIGGSLIFGAFSVLKYYMPKSIITLPNAFYDMLPFVITALILVITSIKKNKGRMQPASCGVNYFREER